MTSASSSDHTHPWRTLQWTSVAVFMALLDATILFVAFPSIRRSFPDVSASNLSWVLNAYTVIYAALLVPAGQFADRVGRRVLFLWGIAVFVAGSIVCGIAPTPLVIVGGRVLQAAGSAALTPASLALVLNAFPRERWSVAVSLWAAVGALAAALGPSAGAAIIQFAGWRWAFFINVPIGILALIRSRSVVRESRDVNAAGRPDGIHLAQLVASIGLVALGLVKLQEWGPAIGVSCIALGLLLLGRFVRRARRVETPAVDLSLFELTNFRYANIATLVFGVAFAAMFLGSILFLTNVWGYQTARAGLAMTPGPLIVMIVAPLAGRAAVRLGHRALLVPGGILFGVAFLTRWFGISSTPHYATEWLPTIAASGIGVGLVSPSLSAASSHGLPGHRLAVGSAVNQAVRQIGSVFGVGAAIALVGTASGHATAPAFSHLFLLLAVCGFVTAAISMRIDTRPGRTALDRGKAFGKVVISHDGSA